MTWINHPALRPCRDMDTQEAWDYANRVMAELGDLMGQFHVLVDRRARRWLCLAFEHHRDPVRNPLGIVARLPRVDTPPSPAPVPRRR